MKCVDCESFMIAIQMHSGPSTISHVFTCLQQNLFYKRTGRQFTLMMIATLTEQFILKHLSVAKATQEVQMFVCLSVNKTPKQLKTIHFNLQQYLPSHTTSHTPPQTTSQHNTTTQHHSTTSQHCIATSHTT